MGFQECYSFGGLDSGYFEGQAEQVMEKLEGEEDIDFTIVALSEGEQCGEAFDQIPVQDREDFLETCRGAETSVSFCSSGQEFIIIKTDKEFLVEEPKALRGVLAHELMHTVQRDGDLENEIEEAAKRYEKEMIETLRDGGLSDEEINRFIYTVFQASIYTLKDLFTNKVLVEQTFVEELETYYYEMLGVDEFCPSPDFYGEEAELEEVQDAITFELGILPAWLPFKSLDRARSDEIRSRIEECYEEGIPEVAEYIHHLEDLYEGTINDPAAFIDTFFQQVVEHSLELMQSVEE
ncbi:MAG: hypothetical protein MUP63_03845 [Candidatus Nanohaloarchaeota archaeon QJJ-7]|nr:hypothetical protein [Candidatus Nanohaloarchaeota archaeon QJJ-7]